MNELRGNVQQAYPHDQIVNCLEFLSKIASSALHWVKKREKEKYVTQLSMMSSIVSEPNLIIDGDTTQFMQSQCQS